MSSETILPEYKEGQLLSIASGHYTIGRVTDRAIMLKCSDGRWGGDGYKPLWIAKSIIHYHDFNDSRDNSQFGIHNVSLPAWFYAQNRKVI